MAPALTDITNELLVEIFSLLNNFELAKITRTCQHFQRLAVPLLYREIHIAVAGAISRRKVFDALDSLALNVSKLQSVRSLSIEGHWVRPDEYKMKARADGDRVTEAERNLCKGVARVLRSTVNLRVFRWRIVAFFSQELHEALTNLPSLTSFEGFVDTRLTYISNRQDLQSDRQLSFGSLCAYKLHGLTSLHVLQLASIRQCAVYGDVIHACPNLSSLWIDVSPSFRSWLNETNLEDSDILSLILRPRVQHVSDLGVSLRPLALKDLRMGNLCIFHSGIVAVEDCIEIEKLETLVLHYCVDNEFMEAIIPRLINLRDFYVDQEEAILYLEDFLESKSIAQLTDGSASAMSMSRSNSDDSDFRPYNHLERLWVSTSLESTDGFSKLAPAINKASRFLHRLVLDLNWGEFDKPGEILQGCEALEELGAWIDCEGDQWEELSAAIAAHPSLKHLCIFNNRSQKVVETDEIASRLYSCAKSNRLGQAFSHLPFNEVTSTSSGSSGDMYLHRHGKLSFIGLRHEVFLGSGVTLTLWKITEEHHHRDVRLERCHIQQAHDTTLFQDVLKIEYFYSDYFSISGIL